MRPVVMRHLPHCIARQIQCRLMPAFTQKLRDAGRVLFMRTMPGNVPGLLFDQASTDKEKRTGSGSNKPECRTPAVEYAYRQSSLDTHKGDGIQPLRLEMRRKMKR